MPKYFFEIATKIHGILYNNSKTENRIVLPAKLGMEFASFIHCQYAHPGSKQLQMLILRSVFIPQIQNTCQRVAHQCEICIRTKSRKKFQPKRIANRQFASVPFEKTYADLYDLGIAGASGKRYQIFGWRTFGIKTRTSGDQSNE